MVDNFNNDMYKNLKTGLDSIHQNSFSKLDTLPKFRYVKSTN